MGITLLLIFVVGLGLLPIVYLQRSRSNWQRAIRENGVPAEAVVLSVTPVRTPSGRYTGWSELTFEFSLPDAAMATRTSVYARSALLESGMFAVGHQLTIKHLPHVPTEAVPDGLDCRPP